MIRIEEINDINLLRVDRLAWDGFVLNSKHYSPFQTFEWITSFAKHFAPSGNLILLFAYDCDLLVGIAPLSKFEFRRLKFLKFKKIVFLGEIFSEYCDFIVHDKYAETVIPLFIDYIFSKYSGINRIDLRDINIDSPTNRLLSKNKKYITSQCNGEKYLFINTSKDKEKYFNQFGKKTLQTLKRKSDKLKEVNAKYIFQDLPNTEKLVELAAFNRYRISQTGSISFFDLAGNMDFIKDIVEQFSQKSILYLNSCIINNENASFYLCFLYQNRLYYFISGFNSKYDGFSIGTSHLNQIINFCFDNGISEFDFMRGEDEYKYRFHPEARYTQRTIIIRKSLFGVLHNIIFKIFQFIKKLL
jgi:CelD/BcsL family acetyltransferase involved in cellulose biosynthesis